MEKKVYRKTSRGQDEIRSRSASIDARMRSLLILTSGRSSTAELAAQMGFDVQPLYDHLLRLGLVEPADDDTQRADAAAAAAPARAVPAPGPAAAAGAGVVAPAAAKAPAAPVAAPPAGPNLRPAKERALDLLGALFGPGGDELAEPLLQARTPEAFRAALTELEAKLAVYQGRKRAAELVQQILGGA